MALEFQYQEICIDLYTTRYIAAGGSKLTQNLARRSV
jgi:hypothetical protein